MPELPGGHHRHLLLSFLSFTMLFLRLCETASPKDYQFDFMVTLIECKINVALTLFKRTLFRLSF